MRLRVNANGSRKYAAIVGRREPKLVVRGINGQMGAVHVRVATETRGRPTKYALSCVPQVRTVRFGVIYSLRERVVRGMWQPSNIGACGRPGIAPVPGLCRQRREFGLPISAVQPTSKATEPSLGDVQI